MPKDKEVYKPKNINEQISHWRERVKGLEEWKELHDYDDANWEQNSRDLNNAYLKINQLKDKRDRRPVSVTETYSLPTFK